MTISAEMSDYKAAAKKVKEGERQVAVAFRKRMREVAKPIGEAVVQEGADPMPARGGLRATLQTRGRVTITATGTRVTANLRGGANLASLNAGRLRHKVWGHGPWVSQSVPAGTYSKALQARKDEAGRALAATARDIMGAL